MRGERHLQRGQMRGEKLAVGAKEQWHVARLGECTRVVGGAHGLEEKNNVAKQIEVMRQAVITSKNAQKGSYREQREKWFMSKRSSDMIKKNSGTDVNFDSCKQFQFLK